MFTEFEQSKAFASRTQLDKKSINSQASRIEISGFEIDLPGTNSTEADSSDGLGSTSTISATLNCKSVIHSPDVIKPRSLVEGKTSFQRIEISVCTDINLSTYRLSILQKTARELRLALRLQVREQARSQLNDKKISNDSFVE